MRDPACGLNPRRESWRFDDQGRPAKATSRTVDMYVLEKSNCVVLPVNQPNKGGRPFAEAGEGWTQMRENTRVAQWGDSSAAVYDQNGDLWMGERSHTSASRSVSSGVLLANWGTFITKVPQ